MLWLTILFSALALFTYMHIAFLVGTLKKDNGVIDSFYGIGFVVVAWVSLLLTGTYHMRQIIVTILVSIWGLRLCIHVTSRNWGKPEDFRYQKMRERFGDKVLIKSYLKIYLFQGLIILLVGFPVLYTNSNDNPDLSWLDFIGIGLWVVGFYFEAIGDYQLRKFLKTPNKTKKVMDQGLWKYTQHPNYFGEVTIWWAFFLMVLNVSFGFVTIFGPALITFMIIKVSGVRLLDKRYEGNDEYADYKRRTSAFIPLPPKKK